MCRFRNENGIEIGYDLVKQAQGSKPYPMSLTGKAIDVVTAAVNRGIDSYLEACFIPDRGDSFMPGKRETANTFICRTLECRVSPESMPVLLRRLFSLEGSDEFEEEARSLASSILTTLGIDEEGKWKPKED